jgi:hypothetical protein
MIVKIIQRQWKEGNTKKKLLWRCLWPQGCERKAARKNIYCEGACDRMALWNFRLRFEPSGLPLLKYTNLGIIIIIIFSTINLLLQMLSSAILWEEEEKLDYRLDLPWN